MNKYRYVIDDYEVGFTTIDYAEGQVVEAVVRMDAHGDTLCELLENAACILIGDGGEELDVKDIWDLDDSLKEDALAHVEEVLKKTKIHG